MTPIYLALVLAAADPGGRTLLADDLQGTTTGRVDGPGRFVDGGGWQSAGGRLILDAGRHTEDGYLEARMRGFTLPDDGAEKSNVFTAWETDGPWDQAKEPGSFAHWRIGRSPGFSVLAAPEGLGTRHESRAPAAMLKDGQPHTYAMRWKNGKIDFLIDGKVAQTMTFPRMRLRYVVLGLDRSGVTKITHKPPVFSHVRMVDYGVPEPTDPPADADVPKFSTFERTFRHAGQYANPYAEVTATAVFARHAGRGPKRVPLYWDGGDAWTVRFQPDAPGRWDWHIESADPGLNGRRGAFRCTFSPNPGGVIAHGYLQFTTQTGKLFWLLGDTNWLALNDDPAQGLDRPSVQRYAAARARQGFNAVLTSALGVGVNSGGPAFHDYSAEAINPAYWREVDARVADLNAQGMLVMLTLAAGGVHDPAVPFKTWADFSSADARRRYARFVAAR
jgi:hypothetical protein